jgi:serine/threonine protein phosphatase 1
VTRVYAIGDIHGHLDKLAAAHALIAADRRRTGDADAPVVHLGDLVDRGPESAEVIDYLTAGPTGAARWITLKGNHDWLFELFLRDPAIRDPGLRPEHSWLHDRIGGQITLASYGIAEPGNRAPADLLREAQARVPAQHQAFLAALPLTFAAPGLLFVHAGIRPGVALADQSPQDMMWIRKDFHLSAADHGAVVVHGHTPVDAPTDYGNRINLDTGAAYGKALTAAVIEDGIPWELTAEGRRPLRRRPAGTAD